MTAILSDNNAQPLGKKISHNVFELIKVKMPDSEITEPGKIQMITAMIRENTVRLLNYRTPEKLL